MVNQTNQTNQTNIEDNLKPSLNLIKETVIEDTSVFAKTENISKKEVESIINSIKSTSTLEHIQVLAIKLGISIFEGSTKTGKPKNKTKSELIEKIKEYKKV